MFLNSDIDYRHFCLEGDFSRGESSDRLNQRYLRGAMKTGCRAITNCLESGSLTVRDVDRLSVSRALPENEQSSVELVHVHLSS
jgi:hypothetical protein